MDKRDVIFFLVPMLLVAVLVDFIIIMLTDVGDWSYNQTLSFMFMNLSFVVFIGFGLFVPHNTNSNIFSLTNTRILVPYVLINVITCMLMMVFGKDSGGHLFPIFEIVVLIVTAIIMSFFISTNRNSAKKDAAICKSRKMVVNIQDTIHCAFNATNDREIRKVIEKAYDKSRSISGYGRVGMETYDEDLARIAQDILASVLSEEYGSIKALCDRFVNVCEDRRIAVKKSQRS